MYRIQNGGVIAKAFLGTVPAAAKSAGTVNGTGIDRKPRGGTGFDSCKVLINNGATSGSPTSFTNTCKVQDSADNSTFADYTPPTGSASAVNSTASSVTEFDVDLSMARRYVRVLETIAFVGGTSPTLLANASLIAFGTNETPYSAT